jgi:hypothetical protein
VSIRAVIAAALAATAVLAVGAPAAGASTFPAWSVPTGLNGVATARMALPAVGAGVVAGGPCGDPTVGDFSSPAGGTSSQVCQGSGLSFVGPATGQIATVIGPTITGSVVLAPIVVSAGAVAAGP